MVKEQLSKKLNLSAKTNFLKNKFDGKRCLVLGCGPSLAEISPQKIKQLSKDYVVFTIKQSFFQYKDISTFQFFNCNNFIKYSSRETVFVCCSPYPEDYGRQAIWGDQEINLHYQILNNKRTSQYIDLSEIRLGDNLSRQVGPGIIYEIVLPFIEHLGFNEILTIGWDYHDKEGPVNHFYPENKRNRLINPAAPPYHGENLESIQNSLKYYEYFKSKGIKLSAKESEKCFLSKAIPRVTI